MKKIWKRALLLNILILLPLPSYGEEASAKEAAKMAHKLQDPLATIAAIITDNDIQFQNKSYKESYLFQLQPVYAFDFPEYNFSFIPRALIPIIGASGEISIPPLEHVLSEDADSIWGVGDSVTQFYFSLNHVQR